MRGLLQEFGHDFLYGSLAADIVVGKNMARYLYHCHNWRVGFNVFKQAKPGAEQAFSLGFLAHLAADTVAHNYFVPYKTVASFHKTNTRHAYWELRYDQRMDRALSLLARQVSTRALREHDAFLDRTLAGASVIPFGVSKQLFRSLLASARMSRFHHVSRSVLARERNLVLEPDLVTETNDLASRRSWGCSREGERARPLARTRPVARNIRLAIDLRKQLKDRTARRHVLPATRTRSRPRRARASEARSTASSCCRARSRSSRRSCGARCRACASAPARAPRSGARLCRARRDRERRPSPGRAVERDAAAVRLHDLAHDEQPEPEPAHLEVARRPLEREEDPLLVRGRDPGPVVVHRDLARARVGADAHVHPRARHVLRRVQDEVREDLLHPQPVPRAAHLVGRVDADRAARLRRARRACRSTTARTLATRSMARAGASAAAW